MSIRDLVLKLTRRRDPASPSRGQRIQAREQAQARRRLLEANQAREHRRGGL